MHQINFIKNLDQQGNATIHFINEEEMKEFILDFSQRILFWFSLIPI